MPRVPDDPFADRPLPQWFQDAKLGVFIHWGPYAVPGWAPLHDGMKVLGEMLGSSGGEEPNVAELLEKLAAQGLDLSNVMGESPYAEWYWNSIACDGSSAARHHADAWGGRPYPEFGADFAKAVVDWDPDAWTGLFSELGARYLVITSKHHDGYCLWPTRTPNPRIAGWHASRDLLADLGASLGGAGIRMALYYSGGLDWSLKGLPMRNLRDMQSAIVQSDTEIAYMNAHVGELIERYAPSVLWGDIGYPENADVHALFRDYYARVPDGVVNDRFQKKMSGAPTRHYDYRTTEYFAPSSIRANKWEICQGIGSSFAFNRQESEETMPSVESLVHLLCDVVSKNGNLLLGVGPRANGSIPEVQQERLRGLARWLEPNAEAIFDTRPWHRHAGETDAGLDVRYTQKGDDLYAIVLGTPPASFVVKGLNAPSATSAERLGGGEARLQQTPEGLRIECGPVPQAPAVALRIRSAFGSG